jgi:putative nucleotidyltransferase with HDIG domain
MPKLMPALADLNSNFSEVVGLIEIDPALTAKLLQMCNSAFFGSTSPIEDIHQAVHQLGYQPISLLATMIEAGAFFRPPEVPGLCFKTLWRHSVTTAYAARAVADSADLQSGLVFTAGLLHDIGKIILARSFADEHAQLLLRAAESAIPAFEAESIHYGYNHAEVGARLLQRWKLPDSLVAGVRYHHQPAGGTASLRYVAACVCVGDFLAHAQQRPKVLDCDDFRSALSLLGLHITQVGRWQKELRESQNLIDAISPRLDMAPQTILLAGAIQSRASTAGIPAYA